MKGAHKSFIIVFLLLVVFFNKSEAQDCSGKLQSAQQLFDSGQIDDIPAILDSCFRNGFSPEEKQKAYKLLIQVYLFNYDKVKADSLMYSFLNENPDYHVKSVDPAEFSELLTQFKVKKVWGIGFSIGNNFPLIHLIENYSTTSLNKLNSHYSPNGLSLSAGLLVNRYFHPNFWISGEVKFSSLNFKNIEKVDGDREKLTYNEDTKWLALPLTLNYSFIHTKWTPFIYGGVEFGYLLSAKSSLERSIEAEGSYPSIVRLSTSVIDSREGFACNAVMGIGTEYKIPSGILSFRAGFDYGLMSFVKQGSQYKNLSQISYDHYIDDNFKINHIFFNINYTRLLYQIKKQVVSENQN